MRTMLLLALAACSVPDKQLTPDAGTTDAAPPQDGMIDDAAPETTITVAPAQFSALGAARFEFESDDVTATFECSVDGDAPIPCTSPVSRTLGDGPHMFAVRAVDTAGNGDDTPAEHVWSIDTVTPDTTLTDKPPAADNSVTVRFDFESNEDNAGFECSLDNSSFSPCESNDQFGPIGDGAHSFAVRARDRAGNVDASPSIHAWTVDTSTPDTQIVSGPEGPTSSTSASFAFISPDAGGGATFLCSLDGAAFSACTSPRQLSGLAAGPHRFSVRVRDAVGNLDPTPATRDWTVDVVAPNTTIVDGPAGIVPNASASFTFSSNESNVTFECRLDNSLFAPCTSPFIMNGLAQGAHSFSVRATDAAGHTDATPATRNWTVDTVAPSINITSGPSTGTTTGPRNTFTFTVTGGGNVECSLDTAPFAPCASPQAMNLPAGPHQFRIHASDAAGNVATETRMWTVACAAPSGAGAAGLLHLDDGEQIVANAVAGGATATLGADITVEPADPSPLVAGRFGGALAFSPLDSDLVAWPAMLGPTTALTVELWARPDAPAGTRDIFATGDARVVIRTVAASPTTVRISIAVVETGPTGQTQIATSAPVDAGAWHHVLASLQEPTLRLWVDGVRTETTGITLGTPASFDAIQLGGNYSGDLDEVFVAQTAITADEPALQRYCPL